MPDNVSQWLEQLGLGEYNNVFIEHDIEWDLLPDLDQDTLKDIGISSAGHRLRILTAAKTLRSDGESDESAPTPTLVQSPDTGGEAERRQLTVMFCDLVGSTALSETMDPEELREVIAAYQGAVVTAIEQYDGYVARYMGDGMLVYFGYPQAHEDDAERAVRAGLGVVESISRLDLQNRVDLHARVGIATGLVVAGDIIGEGASEERAVLGDTPNLAARLERAAPADGVVIAESTQRLVTGRFFLESLPPLSLKGISAPVTAYRVEAESEATSRFDAAAAQGLTPMVGRESEIRLLLDRWEQSRNGEGQLVLLSGEAGIGKSRIARALGDSVTEQPHIRIRYQCSPYHTDSALHPAIQQLTLAAGLTQVADLDAKLDRLEALLAQAGTDPDAPPLIATLLGLNGAARYGKLELSAQQQRNRTLQALVDQMLGLAAQQPVLFILEDAHWIDPTTLELIDLCLDQIVSARVLLLVTARPTFTHGFGGHPIVTRLALNRLGREQVMAIVARLTGGKALPSRVLGEIAEKTDGVPLFVEELTKTVLESDLLRESDGTYVLEGPLDRVAIPSSLHDSLMARLDRLKPVKEVAQTAACIGREFEHELLATVSPLGEREVRAALDRLIEAELIYRRGVPPKVTYMFKHALVRDAAYESLLKSKRREVHARLVDALEHDGGEAAAEIIAHHATQASLTEKAIDYWQQAGEEALARPAYQEAIGHLGQAIHLTREMGREPFWMDREARLQIQLGQALIASQGYGAEPTVVAFERASALAENLGDSPLRLPALYGEWAARYIRAQPTLDHATRYVRLADASSDVGQKLIGLRMLVLERFHEGRLSDALELVDEALALYDLQTHRKLAFQFGHDPRAASLTYRSWILWHLGFPAKAAQASEQSLVWAKQIGHANTIGIAWCWGNVIPNLLQRRIDEVAVQARDLIRYTDELGLPLWSAWGRVFLGWAETHRGQLSEGLGEIAGGLAQLHKLGAKRLLPLVLGLAAEAKGFAGEAADALATVEDAFGTLAQTRDIVWEAELYRIRADLLLSGPVPQPDCAEADYTRAIEIARTQGARIYELRAATRLARSRTEPDERAKGFALLASVYDGFTEGFDSADLQEAKALLDQSAEMD